MYLSTIILLHYMYTSITLYKLYNVIAHSQSLFLLRIVKCPGKLCAYTSPAVKNLDDKISDDRLSF
jgi:hypothetical protein